MAVPRRSGLGAVLAALAFLSITGLAARRGLDAGKPAERRAHGCAPIGARGRGVCGPFDDLCSVARAARQPAPSRFF